MTSRYHSFDCQAQNDDDYHVNYKIDIRKEEN